jgi:hypothetical protein
MVKRFLKLGKLSLKLSSCSCNFAVVPVVGEQFCSCCCCSCFYGLCSCKREAGFEARKLFLDILKLFLIPEDFIQTSIDQLFIFNTDYWVAQYFANYIF